MTALAGIMTEAELQQAVIDLAQMLGYLVHHTSPGMFRGRYRTAVEGDRGFPDLVLVRPSVMGADSSGRYRPGVCIFVELKAAKGALNPEQKRWRDALTATQRWECWRPKQWADGTIERVLRGQA